MKDEDEGRGRERGRRTREHRLQLHDMTLRSVRGLETRV